MYILFLNFIKKNLILLYHTEQLIDGGHEEICDKKVGHGAKRVGNHCSKVYQKTIFSAKWLNFANFRGSWSENYVS